MFLKNRQHVAENRDEPVRIMACYCLKFFELFGRDLLWRSIANMQKTFGILVRDWVALFGCIWRLAISSTGNLKTGWW